MTQPYAIFKKLSSSIMILAKLKVKGWKNIYQRILGLTILILDFKPKKMFYNIRDREEHYIIMIKGSIHKE